EEPYVRDSMDAHKALGIPTQALGQAEMAIRFPMIDFTGVKVGLYEPGFGALMARRAVQTLADIFAQRGGTYVRAMVRPPQGAEPELTELSLSNGERIRADRFVFAAGPWLPKLFPDVVGPRILPTRQEVFFFAPPAGDRRFLPRAMPGWADFNGGDIFYGFPDLEGRGVKFAHDAHGIEVDPDSQDRRPSQAALAEIVAFRDRRFPLLKGAPLTEARVCQYENSSNGDFLIDFHPRFRNVLLVGGGSGHGFKHGPEVGRYAAGRLIGSVKAEPRFSLASKSETHKREVH
ncbi:MAG TPA: FAD-dependent oxidoreductase, partial [Sphingomicrobium sp.]|nr:FAD-dependent oxidoreductase [Sphingomicrobium sp.]